MCVERLVVPCASTDATNTFQMTQLDFSMKYQIKNLRNLAYQCTKK